MLIYLAGFFLSLLEEFQEAQGRAKRKVGRPVRSKRARGVSLILLAIKGSYWSYKAPTGLIRPLRAL